MGDAPNISPKPAVQAESLNYARPGTVHSGQRQFDYVMLVWSAIQSGLALLLCVGLVLSLGAGHHELRSFHSGIDGEAVTWYTRAAWAIASFENWGQVAWLIGSAMLVIGAVTANSAVRRRCYRGYATIFVAMLAAILISFAVVQKCNISQRWAPAGGVPEAWHWFRVEADFYWQIPVMVLIANPAIILLVHRRLSGEYQPPMSVNQVIEPRQL